MDVWVVCSPYMWGNLQSYRVSFTCKDVMREMEECKIGTHELLL